MQGVAKKRLAQAIVLIVVAVSAYVLWQHQGGADEPPQLTKIQGEGHASNATLPSQKASIPSQTPQEVRESPDVPALEHISFATIRKFDAISERMHDALMREHRDEAWAREMEYRWGNAFAANAELLSYGDPVAECRSTQCEIRLLTHTATTLTSSQWNAILTKGAERADWERLRPLIAHATTQMVASFEVDGRTAVLLYVAYLREPLPEGEGADASTSTAPPNSALQRTWQP